MIRTVFRDSNGIRVTNMPGWAAGLVVAGALALAFVVLAASAFLLLLLAPLAIGGALYARWRIRRLMRDLTGRHGDPRNAAARDPRVIDAEYVVIREGAADSPRNRIP